MPGVALELPTGELEIDRAAIHAIQQRLDTQSAKVRFADDFEPVRERGGGGPVGLCLMCTGSRYALDGGLVTDLTVPPAPGSESLGAVTMIDAFVEPVADGLVIHATPPREAYRGMAVTAVRGELWISLARRWAVIDVDAVSPDGRLVLEGLGIDAPATAWRDAEAGLRLTRLDVEGVARAADAFAEDPWLRGSSGELVLVGLPHGPVQLHLRIEGWPSFEGSLAGTSSAIVDGFIPSVPYQAPFPRGLVVHHPVSESVAAGGALGQVGAGYCGAHCDPTWVSFVARSVGAGNYRVAISKRNSAVGALSLEGARFSIANAFDVENCRAGFQRAVAGIAPLGALGDIAVAAYALPRYHESMQTERMALLDARAYLDLCNPREVAGWRSVATLAHELAHVWFGSTVLANGDEATRWWEGLAEYVSSWSLAPAEALELRALWAKAYGAAAATDTVAMKRRLSFDRARTDAYSYFKTALLLTALEDRIGRPAVVVALKRFIADNRDRPGSWSAILAAVRAEAGPDAAAWLDYWLSHAGAPDVHFADVRVSDNRVRGFLVQSDPAFPISVQLGFSHGERTAVPFTGERTPFDLAIPAGADSLAIDPDHRIPLRGDPAGQRHSL